MRCSAESCHVALAMSSNEEMENTTKLLKCLTLCVGYRRTRPPLWSQSYCLLMERLMWEYGHKPLSLRLPGQHSRSVCFILHNYKVFT